MNSNKNLYPLVLLNDDILRTNKKGLLIGIEGIDGAGKSTLSNKLNTKLKKMGISSIVFKNFSGNTLYWKTVMKNKERMKKAKICFPEETDQFLHTFEFLTYTENILPLMLQEYDVVIVDNYILGRIAICQRDTKMKKSVPEQLLIYNILNKKIPLANLTLYLNISLKKARERIKKREIENNILEEPKESIENLTLLKSNFNKLLEENSLLNKNIKKIDATMKISTLIEQIIIIIKPFIHVK